MQFPTREKQRHRNHNKVKPEHQEQRHAKNLVEKFDQFLKVVMKSANFSKIGNSFLGLIVFINCVHAVEIRDDFLDFAIQNGETASQH